MFLCNEFYMLLSADWVPCLVIVLFYALITWIHIHLIISQIGRINEYHEMLKERKEYKKLGGHYWSKYKISGSMDNYKASILCYLTIIGWLIAFFNCEDIEEISNHLTRGLWNSILFLLPIPPIPQIIAIIISIVNINRIRNFEDEYDGVLFNLYENYYSQPRRMIFSRAVVLFIIGLSYLFFTVLFVFFLFFGIAFIFV